MANQISSRPHNHRVRVEVFAGHSRVLAARPAEWEMRLHRVGFPSNRARPSIQKFWENPPFSSWETSR